MAPTKFQLFKRKIKQKISSLVPKFGLNIGAGDWYFPGFIALDSTHIENSEKLTSQTKLKLKNNSLNLIFSSHFFEHVDDLTTLNLLKESFRILSKKGLFRISVPDFELILNKYINNDNDFFDNIMGMKSRYGNWGDHNVESTLENKLLYAFASYKNKQTKLTFPEWIQDPSYYCGPPILNSIEQEEWKALILSKDIGKMSTWAVGKVPEKERLESLGHINWYDFAKIQMMLQNTGFSNVEKSKYGESKSKILRITKFFDNKKEFSLFIEATK